jgi:hypothetical protein
MLEIICYHIKFMATSNQQVASILFLLVFSSIPFLINHKAIHVSKFTLLDLFLDSMQEFNNQDMQFRDQRS